MEVDIFNWGWVESMTIVLSGNTPSRDCVMMPPSLDMIFAAVITRVNSPSGRLVGVGAVNTCGAREITWGRRSTAILSPVSVSEVRLMISPVVNSIKNSGFCVLINPIGDTVGVEGTSMSMVNEKSKKPELPATSVAFTFTSNIPSGRPSWISILNTRRTLEGVEIRRGSMTSPFTSKNADTIGDLFWTSTRITDLLSEVTEPSLGISLKKNGSRSSKKMMCGSENVPVFPNSSSEAAKNALSPGSRFTWVPKKPGGSGVSNINIGKLWSAGSSSNDGEIVILLMAWERTWTPTIS